MSVINNIAGFRGYTVDGGNYPIDSQGRVKRCIFGIKYQYHVNDVTCNISTGADDWGAQMGDGSIIPLFNPVILYQTKTNSIIQFEMQDPYPSNSPCVLVYRSDSAYINIDITDTAQPFTVGSVSGNFALTVDMGNSDSRGFVNTLIATIDYPNQRCDVNFELSTDPSHWGARMGDGSIINLRDPKVLAVNQENAVVQFNMDTSYPSNSPCVLVYLSEAAYYRVIPTNTSRGFVPITSISRVPESMISGTSVSLSTAEISPIYASELHIIWSVVSGPGIINDDKLTATGSGDIVVQATVLGGGESKTDYTQTFTILSITSSITISIQPSKKCNPGDVISVSASSTNGVLLYQWYSNTSDTVDGGVPIHGATSDTLKIPEAAVTRYYYCKLSSPGTATVYTIVCTAEAKMVLNSMSITPTITTFTVDGHRHAHKVLFDPEDYPGVVRWSSSNTNVANIDTNGDLYLLAGGTAVITATEVITGKTASKTITIEPWVAVTGISGIPANIYTNTPVTLQATVLPANAKNKDIIWSIVDAGATRATITSTGVLTAPGSGQLVIKATVKNGTSASTDYSQNFSISVTEKFIFVPVQDIQLSGIDIGNTYETETELDLSPLIIPENASFRDVTFESIDGNAVIYGHSIIAKRAGDVRILATVVNGSGTLTNMTNFTKEFVLKVTEKVIFTPVIDADIEFFYTTEDGSKFSTGNYLKSLYEPDKGLYVNVTPSTATNANNTSVTITRLQYGEYVSTPTESNVTVWHDDASGCISCDDTNTLHISINDMHPNSLYKAFVTIRIKDGKGDGTDFVKDTCFFVTGITADMFIPLTDVDIMLPSRLRSYYPILVSRQAYSPEFPSAINLETYAFDGTTYTPYYHDEDSAVNAYILYPPTDIIAHTINPLPIFVWGMAELYLYPQNPGVLAFRVRIPDASIDETLTTSMHDPVLKDFVKDFVFDIEDPFIRVDSISNIPDKVPVNVPVILSPQITTGKGLDCYNPYWDEEEATYQNVIWSIVSGDAEITEDNVIMARSVGNIVIRAEIENGVDEELVWYSWEVTQDEINAYDVADKDAWGRPYVSEIGDYRNPIIDKDADTKNSYRNVSVPFIAEFSINIVSSDKLQHTVLVTLGMKDGSSIDVCGLTNFRNLCTNHKSIVHIHNFKSGENLVIDKSDIISAKFPVRSVQDLHDFVKLLNIDETIETTESGYKTVNAVNTYTATLDDESDGSENLEFSGFETNTSLSGNSSEFTDYLPTWDPEAKTLSTTYYTNLNSDLSKTGARGSLGAKIIYPNAYGDGIDGSQVFRINRGRMELLSNFWELTVLGINTDPCNDMMVVNRNADGKYDRITINTFVLADVFECEGEEVNSPLLYKALSVSNDSKGEVMTNLTNGGKTLTIDVDESITENMSVQITLSIPQYMYPFADNHLVCGRPDEFEIRFMNVLPIVSTTVAEFRDKSAMVFHMDTFGHASTNSSCTGSMTGYMTIPWSWNLGIHRNVKAVFSTSPTIQDDSNTRFNLTAAVKNNVMTISAESGNPWTWSNVTTYPYLIIMFDTFTDPVNITPELVGWYLCTSKVVKRTITLDINSSEMLPDDFSLKNFGRNFTSLTSVKNIPAVSGESCMEGFLRGCTSFNQELTIPDSVTGKNSMRDFMRDCTSFDSPITLPKHLTGEGCLKSFLRGCINFNKPVDIPSSVTGKECLRSFLQGCKQFDQNLVIPAGVTGWACLFEFMSECESFNKPITLPDNVRDNVEAGREMCNFMRGCDNMVSDITVPADTGTNTEVSEQTLSSKHLASNLSQIGVAIKGPGAEDFLIKVSNKYDTEEWPYTHFRNLD